MAHCIDYTYMFMQIKFYNTLFITQAKDGCVAGRLMHVTCGHDAMPVHLELGFPTGRRINWGGSGEEGWCVQSPGLKENVEMSSVANQAFPARGLPLGSK